MWEIVFNNKFSIITCFVLFISAISCQNTKVESLPYYNTPDFTPVWYDNKDSVEQFVIHKIDSFSFTNQYGETITNETINGKIHVANFFFTTCPSVCPRMTEEFKTLQKNFSDDPEVVLLSYSVTPWKDSIARLSEYAQEHSIQRNKWHLLTGEKSKIYSLARKSYFAEEEIGFQKDSSQFLHTEHFILVDQNGRIRGVYNGTLPLETKRLIADIRLLKK